MRYLLLSAVTLPLALVTLPACGPPPCQDICEDRCEVQKEGGVSSPCEPNAVDYCRLTCGERETL